MTRAALELQVVDHSFPVPSVDCFRLWAHTVLEAAQSDRLELTIRVVDRDEITRLNKNYRQVDGSTNVLSFPFEPIEDIETNLLGDIAICAEVVAEEATEQGKQWEAHWAHMVIHGILHLCGYDHVCLKDADEMEALEVRVLSVLGYSDPYRCDE